MRQPAAPATITEATKQGAKEFLVPKGVQNGWIGCR